jgi:hypothetical protein
MPDDEAAIQRTLDEMATLFDEYDLAFTFDGVPICFATLRVDEDRSVDAGAQLVEYHMGIEVPVEAEGGFPGDSARDFLRDLARRAGDARIEAQALGPHADLVYLATAIHVPDEAPGQIHFGFAWGLADTTVVFIVDTFSAEERANVVRAFAEAARVVADSNDGP